MRQHYATEGVSLQTACFSVVSAFVRLTAKKGVKEGPQHMGRHKIDAVTI